MDKNQEAIARRDFLKLTGMVGINLAASAIGLGVWQARSDRAKADSLSQSLSPDAALKKLLEGNQRFVQQKPIHPDQSKARLQEVAKMQHPFATILSCADSRVPPEILFDEGIGDLFDVRVAGNVAIPEVIGSLEYAAVVLGSPLIMVLGHERCGAVTAAVKGGQLLGYIGTFVKAIEPALKNAKNKAGDDSVDKAVIANVRYQIEELQRNSILLNQRMLENKLKIVGGRYDLDTGEVTIIA
jgi:carbonic anhydrase